MSPIILTATIEPKQTPFVKIRDPKTRLLDYICSIISWLKYSSVKELIFCDNSGAILDWSCINEMANILGKKIEWLSFEGNSLSQILGKGWGEGEILDYVIQNSQVLKNHSHFYKTTGRIFVPSFDHINNMTKEDNAFWLLTNNQLETLFFKCSVSFFQETLQKIYQKSNDRMGVYLTHLYYNSDALNHKSVLGFPKFIGRSATHGGIYSSFYDKDLIKLAEFLSIQVLK